MTSGRTPTLDISTTYCSATTTVKSRDGLHIGTAPGEGQLLGGQRSRKAHPKHPVPVGDGLQNGRRKGEIVGVLGQGESREKCFPAAGRAGGAVAVGEGGFVRSEGYGQLSGQSQRMDAVLTGIQVEQQKAGAVVSVGAMQTSRLRRFSSFG